MSSSNKRVSNLTKSVTDGSGATHFYDVLNGASVVGNAMGVFAQGAASTGHGGRDAGRIAFVRGVLMEPTKIESVIRLARPDAKLLLLAGRWRARAATALLWWAHGGRGDGLRSRMCDRSSGITRARVIATSGTRTRPKDFSVRWPTYSKSSGTVFYLGEVSDVGCMDSSRTLPRPRRRVSPSRPD